MHHVDLIVGKHGIEEIRKGGNQTRPQGVSKILDLGDYPVDGEVRRGPGHRPPAFVEDSGQSRADLAQALSIDYDRLVDGGGRQWRRVRWRHGFLPSSLLRRSHGDGKGGKVRDWVENRSWSLRGGRTEGARATERRAAVYDYESA